MRYELADYEWTAIRPMLPNKPRGVPRVKNRYSRFKFFSRRGQSTEKNAQ
jgi:transposase